MRGTFSFGSKSAPLLVGVDFDCERMNEALQARTPLSITIWKRRLRRWLFTSSLVLRHNWLRSRLRLSVCFACKWLLCLEIKFYMHCLHLRDAINVEEMALGAELVKKRQMQY